MDYGLTGRVALVTGAAGGIGAAVVAVLAAEGCHVALVDNASDEALHAAAAAVQQQGRRAVTLRADVADFERAGAVVDEALDYFGRLDVLVCCAGIARDSVSWKMTESDWDDVVDINLKGCFNYARVAIPVFRAGGGGRVVLIASINGLRGKFGQANYAASKAGLVGLAKTLAREAGRFQVNVNVVAPGMVATAMTKSLPADVVANATNETVLGRISDPRDVADAVVFLCSDRARQITGAVLSVDAGQYI
ncbi:MAG TPA: 3-oxoacyl-ACP reductase FabG [Longimicrobiales bacterium]